MIQELNFHRVKFSNIVL